MLPGSFSLCVVTSPQFKEQSLLMSYLGQNSYFFGVGLLACFSDMA